MLPEGLPKYTLGWGILDWCSQHLVNPDSRGGVKGDQWVFRPDQAKFILWFYAVDEEGQWLYRRAYKEQAKGTGKSPLVAAIACAELLGPAEFSHFENGKAVGKPRSESLIWLTAISMDGCRHTYNYIMGMLRGPAQDAYNLDVGMTRILVKGQSENKALRPITASFRSHEGPQPTFVIAEETQNWTPSERGPDFFETLLRGLSKTNGRIIEVTNTPVPGEGTQAELTRMKWDAIVSGDEQEEGLLFETYGIHVDDIRDPEQALPALEKIYQHAPWINIKRIYRDYLDMQEVNARRFYFNEALAPVDMWITRDEWNAAKRNIKLKKSDLISLGFKFTLECAALVATRIEDGAVFLLKLWERPAGVTQGWEVSYLEIDKYVRWALQRYAVFNMLVDPVNIPEIAGRWAETYEDDVAIEELWLGKNKQKHATAVHMFESALHNNNLIHDGNLDLARHVMNCFVDIVPQGSLLRMETSYSNRYIVAAEAAVLSYKAAQEAIQDGALREEPSRVLYSF